MLENWNDGRMEKWKIGMAECWNSDNPDFHQSIIPLCHHSVIPMKGIIMKNSIFTVRALAWFLILLLAPPPLALTQQGGQAPVIKQEELDQLAAPIALYPDALVSQILMASTYPLEVVQADRFATQNKNLKGDALTKALEQQSWDPSVKSLVNFPQVLTMMSEKLDWTQMLGDAFLAQQKALMDTIQSLRAKAQAAGNLKSTKEQTVIVEQKIIKIEPATPQVIYVPTYNPTVVYGAWPYPAYPPYSYYPPGYAAAASAFAFTAGVAAGAAWGYAWGSTNWSGGSVNINNNQNVNINNNINRTNVQNLPAGGQGQWQHNPASRQGVPYRDQATAQQYNRASNPQAAQSREAFRGRSEQGSQDLARGGGDQLAGRQDAGRGGASQLGGGGGAERGGSGSRGGAFEGIDRGGSSAKSASQRGSASRGSFGGGGGGGRGGGGGGRRR
jgi:Protein of unknown function (DUF3300)